MDTNMFIGNQGNDQIEDFTVKIVGEGNDTFIDANDKRYGEFRIPYTREEIEAALDDVSPQSSTDPLASFGATLFTALFAGELGRSLWRRLEAVERENRGLRLRVLSNLERVQHLPWELLFDPSRRDYMSLSSRVALVRTRPDPYGKGPLLETVPSLRVLAVEADVTGALRTSEDLGILQDIAKANPDRMHLTIVREATPAALEKALTSAPYDVFHFAGTGEVLPYTSKRGGVRQALRLMGAPSTEPRVDRQELGDLLEHAGVRLAVLNACNADWVARSLAKYIPAAIGFRENVRVESCLTLCESLYRSLVAGNPLDLAVTAARQSLDRAHPGTGDWCKLIFYLQQPHGYFLLDALRGRAAAPSGVQSQDKEVAKLSRLLEVYQQNLVALERGASNIQSPDAYRDQLDAVQQKLEKIKRELEHAVKAAG